MIQHRNTLLEARKIYSQCTAKVEQCIAQQGLTDALSTRVIGIGVATEWIRRAAEMDSIYYMGKNLNKSKNNELFVELLRFSFSWFAINAIFTRKELLDLFVGTPSNRGTEYSKFCVLYNSASLTNVSFREQELRQLLNTTIETRLPNMSSQPVTTLEAIYKKYLPSDIRGHTADVIKRAAEAKNADSLDMPTLLYAFRNWSVHGNALHGCFGSHPRFYKYSCLLQETLAEVHYDTAQKLCSLL
jgi:hypothetical protein